MTSEPVEPRAGRSVDAQAPRPPGTSSPQHSSRASVTRLRRSLRALGPGIVTGAADDDPAGIATYSIAGAQFGTGLLWLAPVTWPMMAAVQAMCARVGMVTGGGLMDALRRKLPRPLLALVAASLFCANTFNMGADLAAMADAAELLTSVDSRAWVVTFGLGLAGATMALDYSTIARVLRWLALALLAYVATALLIGPDWGAVVRATFVPMLPRSREAWALIVAVLGTTVSPYLFFWQSSEEVEEELARGRRRPEDRLGATTGELRLRALDVGIGTFASNMAFFFIVLTTALTLHPRGITHPETTTEVAAALRPLAGEFATALYTIGIVGTGALAIPTLAGSAAYAVAELLGWREGMDEPPSSAPGFYAVFTLSIVLAMAMSFAELSPVRTLYWSAILNGLLAPFLLVAILAVAADPVIMAGQPSSRTARVVVGLTAGAMFAAAVAMFVL
ncbi:MAG TPA: divalent metal cation transporter [Gemmatimonadales bacterium]